MSAVPEAAVLISQAVRPGLEADFSQWEHEIATATRARPGFVGQDIYPPVPGLQEDYVVLLRFKDFPSLRGWLECETRRSLLDKGSTLFSKPPVEVFMAAPRETAKAPVVAVIASRVSEDHVEQFKAWQQQMFEAQSKFPGYLGADLFPPVPGISEDWTVIFRFDSDEHMEAWLQSDVRKRMVAEADAQFQTFDLKKIGTFGSWFPPGTEDAPVPPDWMQSMVVVMALFPVVMVCSLATRGILHGVPMAPSIFINNVLGTILLTWLVMPFMMKSMKWWLYPPRDAPAHNLAKGIAVILLYYVVVVAFFTWIT